VTGNKIIIAIFTIVASLMFTTGALGMQNEYATIDQYLTDGSLDIQAISFAFAGANTEQIAPYLVLQIACDPSVSLANYSISIIGRAGNSPFSESVSWLERYQDQIDLGMTTADGNKIITVNAWAQKLKGYAQITQVLIKNNGTIVEAVKIGNPKNGSGFVYDQEYCNNLIYSRNGTTLTVL
jgi:hypothetical protein